MISPSHDQKQRTWKHGGNVSFVDGFLLGLLCAFIAFVVQASMFDPVHLTFYPGAPLGAGEIAWRIGVKDFFVGISRKMSMSLW